MRRQTLISKDAFIDNIIINDSNSKPSSEGFFMSMDGRYSARRQGAGAHMPMGGSADICSSANAPALP